MVLSTFGRFPVFVSVFLATKHVSATNNVVLPTAAYGTNRTPSTWSHRGDLQRIAVMLLFVRDTVCVVSFIVSALTAFLVYVSPCFAFLFQLVVFSYFSSRLSNQGMCPF